MAQHDIFGVMRVGLARVDEHPRGCHEASERDERGGSTDYQHSYQRTGKVMFHDSSVLNVRGARQPPVEH
jgi:hypothetical protein